MKLKEAWNSRYRRIIGADFEDWREKIFQKEIFFEKAAICHPIHLDSHVKSFFNQHHPFFLQCLGLFTPHMSYRVNKSKANIRDQSEERLGAARDLLFATSHHRQIPWHIIRKLIVTPSWENFSSMGYIIIITLWNLCSRVLFTCQNFIHSEQIKTLYPGPNLGKFGKGRQKLQLEQENWSIGFVSINRLDRLNLSKF